MELIIQYLCVALGIYLVFMIGYIVGYLKDKKDTRDVFNYKEGWGDGWESAIKAMAEDDEYKCSITYLDNGKDSMKKVIKAVE